MKLTKKIREASKLIKEVEQEIETLQNYFIMNNKKYFLKKGNLYESNESNVSIGQIDRKGRISLFEGKTRKKTLVLKNNKTNKNLNEDNETNTENIKYNNNENSLIKQDNNLDKELDNNSDFIDETINNNNKTDNKNNNKKNNNEISLIDPDSSQNNSVFIDEPSTETLNDINNIKNSIISNSTNELRNLNNTPNSSISNYNNVNNFAYSGINKDEMQSKKPQNEIELI